VPTITDLHLRRYDPQPVSYRGRFVNNWWSNFAAVGEPVVYRGQSTRILEYAYVAAKNPDAIVSDPTGPGTIRFLDRVFMERSAGAAKKIGSPRSRGGIVELKPGWDEESIAAMDAFLRQRWQPSHRDTQRLMAEPLPHVEVNNWGDNRFGVTLKDWTGRNCLGLLLDIILDEARNGHVSPGADEVDWRQWQVELVEKLNRMEHGVIVTPGSTPSPLRQLGLF
jgi:hypothetical protein